MSIVHEERDIAFQDALESIDRYVKHGIPPGGFLTCVLSNDLMGAVGSADEHSLANLTRICRHVYHTIPAIAHGSSERMAAWMAARARERAK